MKKLTKKAFALLMSIVMVLTALTVFPFTASADSAEREALASAIEAYEAKMDGTVYTNMSKAYTAYKSAIGAANAYDNGRTVDLEGATVALVQQTEQMTAYTGITATGTASINGVTIDSGYYNNLVAYKGTDTTFTGGTEILRKRGLLVYGCFAYIYYPRCVFLYDGVNPISVPVMSGLKEGSRYAYKAKGIYIVENDDFKMKNDIWYGGNVDFNWNAGTGLTLAATAPSGSNANLIEVGSSNSAVSLKNSIIYKGGAFDENVKVIGKTSWNAYGDNGSDSSDGTEYSMSWSNGIYLINQKKMSEAIAAAGEDAAQYISAVSDYKAGGLESIFSAFDAATSLNPANYNFASDVVYYADKYSEDMDKAIAGLQNLKPSSISAQMNTLIEYVKDYERKIAAIDGENTMVYMNMYNTYVDYIKAKEYIDAYTYGDTTEFEDPTLEELVVSFHDNLEAMTDFDMESANVVPTFSTFTTNTKSSEVTSLYDNIIYWQQGLNHVGERFANKGDINNYVYYSPTVLLYDGINDAKLPVQYVGYNTASPLLSINETKRYVYTVSLINTANFNIINHLWKGIAEADHDDDDSMNMDSLALNWSGCMDGTSVAQYDSSYYSTTNHITAYITAGDTKDSSVTPYIFADKKHNSKSGREARNGYANGIKYISGATDFAGATEATSKKFVLSWRARTGSGTSETNVKTSDTNTDEQTPIYVINIVPVLKKLSEQKDVFNAIPNSDTGAAEIMDFLKKVDGVTGIDISMGTIDYAANIETGVKTAVDKINGACTDMEKAAEIVEEGEFDKDEEYEDLRQEIVISFDYDTNYDCFDMKLWDDYEAALQTAKDEINAVMSNIYTDKSTAETAAENLRVSREALIAGGRKHLFGYDSEDNDLATFVCVVDKTNHEKVEGVDVSVYNYMNLVYETLDHEKYSDEANSALAEAKRKFDAFKTTDRFDENDYNEQREIGTQDLINESDKRVTELLTAINENNVELSVQTFSVDFSVVDENGVLYSNVDGTGEYAYGSVVKLEAPEEYGKIYKWELTDDNGLGENTQTLCVDSSTYEVKTQSNIKVKAYASPVCPEYAVKIVDAFGRTVNILPASAEDEVTVSGTKLRVNGIDYSLLSKGNYILTGYSLSGSVKVSEAAVDGVLTVKGEYSNPDGGYVASVGYDGKNVQENIAYDAFTTVTGDNQSYALAILNNGALTPIAYGDSYSYLAYKDESFYEIMKDGNGYYINDGRATAVNDKLTLHMLNFGLPFIYSYAESTGAEGDEKFTTHSAYTQNLPEGVTVVEAGTLFSKNNGLTADDFVIGTEGVYIQKSKKTIDSTKQFSLSIVKRDEAVVYTRAYVKYKFFFINSDGESEDYEAIYYGNICSSANV